MAHQMRLHPAPFAAVTRGSKRIEIRLNDEKRQELRVGDQIEFVSRVQPSESVFVEITALHHFSTFKDLCESFPPEAYGSASSDEYEQMYQYYSKEAESRYGVVGIEFKREHKIVL